VAVDPEAVGGAQGVGRRYRITHIEFDVIDVEDVHSVFSLRFLRLRVVPGRPVE
jgi:hypothetical protein